MINNKGFTLIELSIVIVIIGLIVAGVVGGQALVRQAQFRGSIKELTSYELALNAFRLEYDSIPGDMVNATAYWGGATVDGDGNDIIAYSTEGYRAWQHLSLAKILPGSYLGVQQGADTLGSALPKASIPSAGYGFFNLNLAAVMLWTGSGSNQSYNLIRVGPLIVDGANTRIGRGHLRPNEAKLIDEKLDDGYPGLGKLIMQYNWSTNCVTSDDMLTSEYDFSNSVDDCAPQYVWQRRK